MSDDEDDGGVSRSAVLTALGIGSGVWASLVSFGEEISEAGSIRELILGVFLESVVNAALSVVGYLYAEFLYAVDLVSESFWMSFVEPFGTLYTAFTEVLIGPLEAIRTTAETTVATTGLAAPFVALAGWVAVLLVVAVIVGVLWAFVETYLPTEAVTENADRLWEFATLPFAVLGNLVRGLIRALSGGSNETDGGTDER